MPKFRLWQGDLSLLSDFDSEGNRIVGGWRGTRWTPPVSSIVMNKVYSDAWKAKAADILRQSEERQVQEFVVYVFPLFITLVVGECA